MVDVRILDIHPALGFETPERWEVAVAQRDEQLRKAGKGLGDSHHRLWGEQRMAVNNLAKIIACIPGLNLIVGIARIIMNACEYCTRNPESLSRPIYVRHIYRGIADIFFGPLLLIADIVQTIRDQSVVQEYRRTHPKNPV